MSQYSTAIEHRFATCLPPEAYIRIWESSKQHDAPPRFMSSVYPKKVQQTITKQKVTLNEKV
jgi:hypothetical protein